MKRLVSIAASAALLVPAATASARPADSRAPVTTSTPAPVVVRESSDAGFDWGDAGIGAGATGGLVLIAAGAFAASYRVRTRVAR
jgi:hypothetical protein